MPRATTSVAATSVAAASVTMGLSLPVHVATLIGLAASAVFLAGRAPPASAPATATSAAGLLGLVWSFIHVLFLPLLISGWFYIATLPEFGSLRQKPDHSIDLIR